MIGKRRLWLTYFRCTWGIQEVGGAASKHDRTTIGFHGEGSLFVNANPFCRGCPAVLDNACKERDQPSYAITGHEVTVSDYAAHIWQNKKVAIECDLPVVRVGKCSVK